MYSKGQVVTMLRTARKAVLVGNTVQGLAHLQQGLLGVRHGEITDLYELERRELTQLLNWALRFDIEPKAVQALQARHDLPLDVRHASTRVVWPVRIQTLGQFRVYREGQLLEFMGNDQRKSLECILALAIAGEAGLPTVGLRAQVWPQLQEAERRRVYRMTVMRLQQVLGEDALHIQNKIIRFNPLVVWSDLNAIEHQVQQIQGIARLPGTRPERLKSGVSSIARIYYRHFGHQLPKTYWSRMLRHQLQAWVAQASMALSEYLRAQDRTDEATVVLERVRQVAPVDEPLCHYMMDLYASIDRMAEVSMVYRELDVTLLNWFRRRPSEELTGHYHALLTRQTVVDAA